MRIKLVGQIGRVAQSGGTVITALTVKSAPPLPKDLPTPPDTPVNYILYIANKQWSKVKEALGAADALLVAEGYCFYNDELKQISVLVQSVQVGTRKQ